MEGEGITIVGLPQLAAAVILACAVLLGAICIARKRHKVSSAHYVWVTLATLMIYIYWLGLEFCGTKLCEWYN